MENSRQLITDAKQLIDWLDENDILMNLAESDVTLLMNYMEGHGFQIGLCEDGLVKCNINDVADQFDMTSIDDMIDTVCEWNYEMLQIAKENLKNSVGMSDYLHRKEYYNGLRSDEKALDQMFEQTCYGKEIYSLAEKLAGEAIEHLQRTGKLDQATLVVSDAIRGYPMEQEKGKVR
jgi:hypothetical protein